MLPILMTASVSTRGMKGACFTDDERERMYLNALSYYLLALPDAKIVFAENSGWNLEDFARKLPEECRRRLGDVEFISLPIDLFDNSRGKGYNETIIMHEAVLRSNFIGEAGQFFKVTGRYPIYNLGYFLCKAEKALAKDAKSTATSKTISCMTGSERAGQVTHLKHACLHAVTTFLKMCSTAGLRSVTTMKGGCLRMYISRP